MLTIGELSKATGANVSTIRYFEQTGLLPRPDRSGGNQRRYTEMERKRLSFIRQARDLGMSVDSVRGLLDLEDGMKVEPEDADRLVVELLHTVSNKIDSLRRLEAELLRALADNSSARSSRVATISSLVD